MFPSPRAGTLPCWKYIVLITDGMCKKDWLCYMCCTYSDDIIPNVWNWKRLSRGHLKQSLTIKALVYIPLPILALIIGPSR